MNLNIKAVIKPDPKRKHVEVRTSKARVSFPNFFEAKAFIDPKTRQPKGEPKYTGTFLFPKKSDIKPLRQAVAEAAKMVFGAKIPKGFVDPIKDGNEIYEEKIAQEIEGYEHYKGMWVVNMSTGEKFPPRVVGRNREELDQSDIYGGCWGIAACIAKAYSTGSNKGVTFYLNGFQKTDDDDRLGGGQRSAESMFDEMEDGSEDESNYESEEDSEGYESFEDED